MNRKAVITMEVTRVAALDRRDAQNDRGLGKVTRLIKTRYTHFKIRSTSELWIRNWQMLLHMCWVDAVCALARWQHFYS